MWVISVVMTSLYYTQEGFGNLGSARQSEMDTNEKHHSPIGKGDEENQFGKVAASQNSQKLTKCGINVVQDSKKKNGISGVKTVLAVAAGKGGVGKSTVSVQLALALKNQGFRVGLLDADIYGPSLGQMLPEGMEPAEDQNNPEMMLPGLAFGMPYISIAHFKKEASIVRAPVANQIIEQFLSIIDWGELDYLILDFPPGTGDIQLTLMQKAKISSAVVVTTPQIVATLDVGKAIQLFQKMEIPVLGVVENMSYFEEAGQKFFPFGSGGGGELSKKFNIPLLGQIPIDSKISEGGDLGQALPENSTSSVAFNEVCKKVLDEEKKLSQKELAVRQKGPYHLEVEFEGKWHPLLLKELQKQCPCARCEKEKRVADQVSLLEFSSVGMYAIRITFSSGCSQGIYPFALLKKVAGL